MYQRLLHNVDARAARIGRAASIVLVVVFVGWLALFGVSAPWDVGDSDVGAGEFLGRFFGLLLLLGLILAPLAVAAIVEKHHHT